MFVCVFVSLPQYYLCVVSDFGNYQRDLWASSGGNAVLHHFMPGPQSQSAERLGLSVMFNFIVNQVLILVVLVLQV